MGSIVCIHSYRGGTGKSNTTANLAVTLARRGRSVAIVDTDIQSPGVHALFGLDEGKVRHSLNEFLWGQCSISDTAHELTAELTLPTGQPAVDQGRVYLMPCSTRAEDITRILRNGYDMDKLQEALRDVVDHLGLDYLFVDSHPGLNEETLLCMASSDVVILILRPDRQDFQGTAITVNVARTLEVSNMLLIINKAPPSLDPAALRQQVETAYNAPLAGLFRHADEMMLLGSAGVFCLQFPDHVLTREYEAVIDRLEAAAAA